MLKKTNDGRLPRVREVLERLRSGTEPYIGLHAIVALMLVAESMPEGIGQKELQVQAGVSKSAIDRITDQLGEWKDEGVPGLQLIEEFTPPEDRRKSVFRLSKKGEKLMREVASIS